MDKRQRNNVMMFPYDVFDVYGTFILILSNLDVINN